MNIELRLFIIGMFLVITTMAVATQFAFLDITYDESEHEIIIPTIIDYGLRYIGSDNSTDGKRVFRIDQDDADNYKIFLGNFSMNYRWTYTAALGIVNEDNISKHITHLEISPPTSNYLKIWLHGDRDGNADNISDDSTSVLMYDNGTVISGSDTIVWTLAPGDGNASTICSNITDRNQYTNAIKYDEVAKIRYSYNNTNAISELSDYVWMQVELNIPNDVALQQVIAGYMYIYLESD